MNYTNVDQSKKLVELGINPNTADMCYQYVKFDKENELQYFASLSLPKKNDIPCWSTGALIDLLPTEIKEQDFRFTGTYYYSSIIKHYSDIDIVYRIQYEYNGYCKVIFEESKLIDALIYMIEWLKKNKYL